MHGYTFRLPIASWQLSPYKILLAMCVGGWLHGIPTMMCATQVFSSNLKLDIALSRKHAGKNNIAKNISLVE